MTPLVYAMYKGADLDAYVASLARRTLTQLPSHTLESMRALQAADAAATLQVYRRHCAQAALAMRSELLREWFDLDDDRQVVCGISFGYPDPDHPTASYRTSRASLDEAADLRL